MTQDTKVKIWAIVISASTSMLVMIVSFSLYAGRDNDKVMEQKLDKKVDKVEYKEDCLRTNTRIDKIENTYDLLIEIKTDIKWLKEERKQDKY